MANRSTSNSENILIKVDQNNLIYVDPNSVVEDGIVSPRGTNSENFVYYVNLEADIIPRTILNASNKSSEGGSLQSIAKGTLNLLENKKGEYLDTGWTEVYTPTDPKTKSDISDSSGQSFGISNIQIDVRGTNFIPTVTINFLDVRGKTLFESPENSPYKAFFHLPWPIFYLTVKGFYGKAIKYRLHLTSFNTTYNDSNGNFEIVTKFVGSTYAYLNDIPLTAILNAPYMYGIEKSVKGNTTNGVTDVTLSKSSKGYQTLLSIYQEYRNKGLIDIPSDINPTFRELIVKAKTIDKKLEEQIFNGVVDMKLLGHVKELGDQITKLKSGVTQWSKIHLTKEYVTLNVADGSVEQKYYYLVKTEENKLTNVIGSGGTKLESILDINMKKIIEHQNAIKEVIRGTKTKYKDFNFNIKNLKPIGDYYRLNSGKYVLSSDLLLDHINEIEKVYNQEKSKLQDFLEGQMNTLYENKEFGLGFSPTIRNVFGILLANADTYIRLMKNVHYQAYNVREERKDILKGFSDETVGDAIYPWPEVKKQSGKNDKILAYPADQDLIKKLQSNNKVLWPEVNFVEEFIGVSTQRTDNLAEKEKTFDEVTYRFENSDFEEQTIKRTSTFNSLHNTVPYLDKSIATMLYEIMERVRYSTLYDSFDVETTIYELGELEFKTLQELIKEDYFIVDILREVSTIDKFKDKLSGFSPFERYPYYVDGIPSISYIKDLNDKSYKIESYYDVELYTNESTLVNNDSEYPRLQKNLDNYKVEDYRLKVYPFNSSTYLGYIGKTSITQNEMNLKNTFKVDTGVGFIRTPVKTGEWLRDGVGIRDLFDTRSYYRIGSNGASVFNTPYFHSVLNEDFYNSSTRGKYINSAYLFINSLPFKDLSENINLGGGNVRMSNLFTEVGSSHYVPYHLMVKWGSMYHRYKRFILDGVDIMSGVTTPIDGGEFFDNNQGLTYLFDVERSTQTDVGIHPYYSSIYHQIVNGYLYYDITTTGSTNFNLAHTNKVVYVKYSTHGSKRYFTSFVDNSKFDIKDSRFTILPSYGPEQKTTHLDFAGSEQFNFICDWNAPQTTEFEFSGTTFPSYNESLSDTSGVISIDSNNKKVFDLIATFNPQILKEFEETFIYFASEKVDSYSTYKKYNGVNYDTFQSILKGLFSVEKKSTDDLTNMDTLIDVIKRRQKLEQIKVSELIMAPSSLIKITIGNPKELDLNVLHSYTGIIDRVDTTTYSSSQLTSNLKYIKLYVGEDMDSYYQEFFSTSNIELSEENVLRYRSLMYLYGGFRKSGGSASKTSFAEYLLTNILNPHESRISMFLSTLLKRFPTLKRVKDDNDDVRIIGGYGDSPIKLETYNNFKNFNDKWTAGNSIGNRLLMEEFLFLDRANRDIGDTLFMDIKKLIGLGDIKNQNLELYGVISMMIAGSNVDLRALPAYVNFYGNNSGKTKVKSSSNVASTMFGKFLDVDLEFSQPKMLLQYVGKQSEHLNVSSIDKDYKFKDDSVDVGSTSNNPILITDPEYFNNENLSKSNKVVAFEVSFGDQNQGIFKSISLDQSQFRSTFESMQAVENMARAEAGVGVSNIDTALFDIYKTRSYSCKVSCMGNVMIQPTMYFQLKNVPLFEGAYWITEVSHNISNNSINTEFTGVRMPKGSLPDPRSHFATSYRVLFDKILNSALAKINSEKTVTTEETIKTKTGTFIVDLGGIKFPGEELYIQSGVDEFAIPFNGYNNIKGIQKVKYKGEVWYRTKVRRLQNVTSDGNAMYLPSISSQTVKPSTLKWSELKDRTTKDYFYRLAFDNATLNKGFETYSILGSTKNIADKILINSTTKFLNPVNGKTLTFKTDMNLDSTQGTRYVNGPIDSGGDDFLDKDGKMVYTGIAVSEKIMKELLLLETEVLYFKLE